MKQHRAAVALPVPLLLAVLAACSSGQTVTSSSSSTRAAASVGSAASTPPAKPPGSPGGASSGAAVSGTGALAWDSGTATKPGGSYVAIGEDESGVLVKGGSLILRDARISTSGDTSSQDDSSFYGLNAGVIAFSAGKVALIGGSIRTSGSGANGLFAYGSGASASMRGGTITAEANGGHGAMAAGGGKVTIKNVTIHTAGASGAAVATDRGGGTITVDGGTMTTTGFRSPGIYSTGEIVVTGARIDAKGAEAAVVEGANSITAIDSSLTGTLNHGVMLYNSMSGDANAGTGTYTMKRGSLTAKAGPAFFITNTTAHIALSGDAKVTARSGILVEASAAGTGSGNANPATVVFTAGGETLSGDLAADPTSTLDVKLSNGTRLAGALTHAAVTLDASSTWTVTGNSTLTSLSDAAISGSKITNIIGNRHRVTYDKSAATALGGKTYTLKDGGELTPA
jgi:hypothetical protein